MKRLLAIAGGALLFLLLILFAFFVPCRAPDFSFEIRTPLPSDQTSQRQALSEFFASLHRVIGFSGVVYIARSDTVIFSEQYGFADDDRKIPNSGQTPFLLASVTKQFTGTAIELLERQGKLTRSDPIGRFLPELAGTAWGQVPIADFMDHRSGLPRYFPASTFLHSLTRDGYLYSSPEALQRFLKFNPASKGAGAFHYSDLGYQLLRIIVSRASGMEWADYLNKYLFEPAGLAHTRIRSPGSKAESRGYVVLAPLLNHQRTARIRMPCWNYSLFYGAIGVESTLDDLIKWDQFLRAHEADYLQNLQNKYLPKLGEGYSSGFAFVRRKDGNVLIKHDGFEPGHYAGYYRIPEMNLTVLLLSNSTPPKPPKKGTYNPVEQLIELLLGHSYRVLH